MRVLCGNTRGEQRRTVWLVFSALLAVCCWTLAIAPTDACSGEMKGPKAPNTATQGSGRAQEADDEPFETSCVKLASQGAIRFYQKWISPVGGKNRCGFSPSCSAYGHQAFRKHGSVVGLMMTADRLTRCNIWKKAGPDYTLLPNGKLFDPPFKNLISEKP